MKYLSIFTATIAGVELNGLWLQGGAVTVLFSGLSLVTGMIWIIFHLSGSYAHCSVCTKYWKICKKLHIFTFKFIYNNFHQLSVAGT